MTEDQLNYFEVLGVKIQATNLESACKVIARWVNERKQTYVCLAPVATIVDCQRNEEYKNIINQSGMTTPDGMPLVWLGKRRGFSTIDRTYGPDLLQAVLANDLTKNFRHYFYGGNEETNRLLTSEIARRYPWVRIVGRYAPPFREISEDETPEVLRQINDVRPDILWVGLGSPKQDLWMARHRKFLDVPVMIAVGAAFDFLAGTKPQAPLLMQRCGLEWLFRLCCEPQRLWRRYLVGNILFIYFLIQESIRSNFHHTHETKS